jgi:histidinol dehydrogenase
MSGPLRYSGSVAALCAAERRSLVERGVRTGDEIATTVAGIIADVRERGDAALREMARRFDGAQLDSLEVPHSEIVRALGDMPNDLRAALERAADNIATVHRAFAPSCAEIESEPGVVVGRRPDPLHRVGVYAPGGRAAYPSSVLMGVVPARVAGVSEIILCSPPDATGRPPASVLAASAIAGVDRVFSVGGAGAVAAMALGTESIARVDRIVGPGNAYVAEAKLQLVGDVGIDSPAGPSELLVIADDTTAPRDVALEMVGQAEHDPSACVVAIAIGADVARRIEAELMSAARSAARREIVEAALSANGGVLVAADRAEAAAFATEYAAEHVWLAVAEPDTLLAAIRNSGTVFVGRDASVAFGDYMTGANHVLPTGGRARTYSGLSPFDFIRWTTYQRITADGARALAADVALFAEAEALPGHAAAARRSEG